MTTAGKVGSNHALAITFQPSADLFINPGVQPLFMYDLLRFQTGRLHVCLRRREAVAAGSITTASNGLSVEGSGLVR